LPVKDRNIAVQIVITIAAWICFFLMPFLFFPYLRTTHPPLQSPRFLSLFIASNVLLILFYYFNNKILFPRTLAQKKIFLYLLIVFGFLFIYLTIIYLIDNNSLETKQFLQTQFAKDRNLRQANYFSAGPMVQFLLALTVSSGSKLIEQWFSAEEIKDEISKQQLQTELSLLKSQVNPHFLFNTLNGIYSLAMTDNEKTADAVMKLSRIMRYTLEESQNDFVALDQEIEFINSYINLQEIRLTNNVQISMNVSGNTDTVQVAPLMFIPFIENAFKYGISAHRASRIEIKIKAVKGEIHFSCVNDVISHSRIMLEKSTGTGISNVQRRLHLLYEGRYTLNILETENNYKVTLNLNTAA
jgi:sensor histidine kinase YesM